MKILLDANLSWRLVNKLKDHFEEVQHVDSTTLEFPAKDLEIWNYAKTNEFIIITNDEDFLNLLLSLGFPPKIVLLRTGNQSTQFITDILIRHFTDISSMQKDSKTGILQLY